MISEYKPLTGGVGRRRRPLVVSLCWQVLSQLSGQVSNLVVCTWAPSLTPQLTLVVPGSSCRLIQLKGKVASRMMITEPPTPRTPLFPLSFTSGPTAATEASS